MDKVHKACADATRRKILKLLRDRDMTAGEIAAHFEVSKPTLSKHFAVLREAGLVQHIKNGRNIIYHFNAAVLENALLSLMEDYDFVWMPSADISSIARELVESLVTQDFEEVIKEFDSQMAGTLTLDKLREAWDMITTQFGPFVKQLGVRTERYWKYTAAIVTCQFARSKIDIKVTFVRSGKISGLWMLKTE